MATQNEKNARKTLVVQEVMNEFGPHSELDAELFQTELVKRGYLIMAL
jgi:hypothetical protein